MNLFSISVFLSWISMMSYPSCAQGRDRELYFPSYYFFAKQRLLNHKIKDVSVKSLDECEYLCYMNDACVSLNIKNPVSGRHGCELNNSTHIEDHEDLVPDQFYYYRGAKNNCGKSGRRPCENNSTCQSGFTNKGYWCVCTLGFEDEHFEKDTDECKKGLHKCHVNASCVNTNGSYTCLCKNGYTGDGQNCTDVDECSTSAGVCNNNANCQNVLESYLCSCKAGFTGDGKTCHVDGCQNHQNLSNAERKVTSQSGSTGCDTDLVGWYRFQAAAGAKMATTCPTTNQKCGANFQAWLSEPHPNMTEGQTSKKVCIKRGNDKCHNWFNIQVKSCSSYYVYKFNTAPTSCNFRYCGMD